MSRRGEQTQRRARTTFPIWVTLVALGAALIGYLAARQFHSPSAAEADLSPPPSSVISVPIELRELEASIVSRGDLVVEDSLELAIDPSALLETGLTPLITRLPTNVGGEIDSGTVVLEIAQRPVFVLRGDVPMFRDLEPGATGADVEQLQRALRDLGLGVDISGTFDGSTESAVAELYRSAGYEPAGPNDQQVAEAEAALERVAQAEATLEAAREALISLTRPIPGSELLALDAAVEEAERALESAKALRREGNLAASQAFDEAVVAQTNAQANAEIARARLDEALSGTHPDTLVPPTAEEIDSLESAVDQALEDANAADEAVELATSSRERTRTDLRSAVQRARSDLEIAELRLVEARRGPDSGPARKAVSDAEADLETALADQVLVEARTGVRVLRGEVMFVAQLPRSVQALHARPGEVLDGPAMTLSGATVVVETSVPESERHLVAVGGAAVVDDDAGFVFDATVREVADEPELSAGVSGRRHRVVLAPNDPLDVLAAGPGLSLRVTIPISSSGGDVLVVPLAALAARPDGSLYVEVETSPDRTRTVRVTAGIESGGYVAVSPVDGVLTPGEFVVVGRS